MKPRKKFRIRLKFEPRDLWIGVYYKSSKDQGDIYICLLPCLPIHIEWWHAWSQVYLP